MKHTTIFLIFMTLLASCSSNTIYDEPKDLIPKDSMVLLLKDLYLATSAKSIKNKKQQKKISYTPLVYNTYKIDSLRFSTSNFFYTSKVDVYEPMLDQVMALLKKEQVFFTEAKKIKDSIFNDSIKKKKEKMTKDPKEKEFEKFDVSKKRRSPKEFLKKKKAFFFFKNSLGLLLFLETSNFSNSFSLGSFVIFSFFFFIESLKIESFIFFASVKKTCSFFNNAITWSSIGS